MVSHPVGAYLYWSGSGYMCGPMKVVGVGRYGATFFYDVLLRGWTSTTRIEHSDCLEVLTDREAKNMKRRMSYRDKRRRVNG